VQRSLPLPKLDGQRSELENDHHSWVNPRLHVKGASLVEQQKSRQRQPSNADDFDKIIKALRTERTKIHTLAEALKYLRVQDTSNVLDWVSSAEWNLSFSLNLMRRARREMNKVHPVKKQKK
jgi:hypothetical protein